MATGRVTPMSFAVQMRQLPGGTGPAAPGWQPRFTAAVAISVHVAVALFGNVALVLAGLDREARRRSSRCALLI